MQPGFSFHQKWVCNRPKERYNLAERALFPIPLTLLAAAANGRQSRRGKGRSQRGTAKVHETPRTMATACRHPKVRVVSRHEDSEFVECLECGEVFDAEEFRDMEIEDTAGTEDLEDDS